jgi:hypothetical protein
MEQAPNPDLDTLALLRHGQADLLEQIRLSADAIKQSEELLRRIDEELARAWRSAH